MHTVDSRMNSILHCPAGKSSEKAYYGTYYGMNTYIANVYAQAGRYWLKYNKISKPSEIPYVADGKIFAGYDYRNSVPNYYLVFWRHNGAAVHLYVGYACQCSTTKKRPCR